MYIGTDFWECGPEDFVKHPICVLAGLSLWHVFALRAYTTDAYPWYACACACVCVRVCSHCGPVPLVRIRGVCVHTHTLVWCVCTRVCAHTCIVYTYTHMYIWLYIRHTHTHIGSTTRCVCARSRILSCSPCTFSTRLSKCWRQVRLLYVIMLFINFILLYLCTY